MKTPAFIFKPEFLKQNYKDFHSICMKYLNNFRIAYSVKTNSNPDVLKTLHTLNSGFEIASLEEIKQIKNIINNQTFVVFNSACKTNSELKQAIQNRFLINVDSVSELKKISRILKGKQLDIGLRVSLESSKFGIDISNLQKTIEFAKKKNLNIISLSCHPGTQMNFTQYKNYLRNFSNTIQRLNLNLKYIDLGGGFPDKQQLKNLNIVLESYIHLIKYYFSKFNSTIILEPGRVLVSDTTHLITKIIAIKENYSHNYAILDAGINLLSKITLANYRFTKVEKSKKQTKKTKKAQEYILAGPLLFGNDILGKFYGNLKEGDLIKINNVGAYCYNLAWEISYKKPKIIIR